MSLDSLLRARYEAQSGIFENNKKDGKAKRQCETESVFRIERGFLL